MYYLLFIISNCKESTTAELSPTIIIGSVHISQSEDTRELLMLQNGLE